ncbi:MAG TPA: hypothetical protein VFC09_06520 [Candidatus Dormibacteraeota bacterium]|nr:hypothetical protein [Candidatus Dormibacteraeota bacterium]
MPRLRSVAMAAAASCAAVVATLGPAAGLTASASGTPFFGVLDAGGGDATAEAGAGISVASLELNWSAYQPAPGQVSSSYVSSMRTRLQQLRAAGLNVVLDVGMQYPPSWIFSVDANTRFVDQYGDVWHSSLSQDIPNAVFDQNVRNYEAAYIAQVAADFGDVFWAVRAGGLLQDELRYPDASYNGHSNCYWAFDANAQAGSPVPGWIPGQAGTTQASQFLNYYLQSITDFSNWLVSTYRAHFPSPWIQVLYPSWGLRPGDTDNAIASDLNGSTPPASWGTLEMGLDWSRQVSSLPDSHVMVYGTWMERGDDGSTANTMAPTHYLATLGAARGLPAAGENASSGDDLTTMQTVVSNARGWGLAGLMWLNEASLFSTSTANLAAYSALIHAGPWAPPGSPPPSSVSSPSIPAPPPGTSIPTWGGGYWLVASDGGIFPFGGAAGYGSTGNLRLNRPIVGMASTPDHGGYWLVAADGGIFPFGDAVGYGSTGNIRLNQPIVGMAATPSGRGYWLVAADGGIFPFGDAGGYGSTGGIRLNKPVVGMTATPSGRGYWLVASDGGIFPFGDAAGYGSTGSVRLNRPIVGMAATPNGGGYWLVASDGGIFPFGNAGGYGSTGSMGLTDIVGMAPSGDGRGYRLVGAAGGVYCFGDAGFGGSAAGLPLARPIVGVGA